MASNVSFCWIPFGAFFVMPPAVLKVICAMLTTLNLNAKYETYHIPTMTVAIGRLCLLRSIPIDTCFRCANQSLQRDVGSFCQLLSLSLLLVRVRCCA